MSLATPHAAAQALESLLEEFDRDPAETGRRIRALLNAGHAWFAAAAVPALKKPGNTAGRGYLVTLLAATGLLPECLADRAFAAGEACALARAAAAAGHDLDLAIAQRLSEPRRPDDATTTRLLEILEAVIRTPRTAALLKHLEEDPNPRIRSKAALLVGRASRNARWAERQMGSPDARVRANAVEALWHGDPQACRPLFRQAARDPNCRVAGNGAMGLYLMGESESVALLADMAAHSAPEFRAAAVWSMGETRDPRWMPLLTRMLRESEGKVRQNVLRALARIRQNVAALRALEPLRVEVSEAQDTGGGWRRLRVAVADGAGSDPGRFPATRFALTEGEAMIREFEVAPMEVPAVLAVGFALPAELPGAAADCMRLGRGEDVWGGVEYAPESAETAPDSDILAPFSRQFARLGREHGLPRALELLLRTPVPGGAKRHLVVVGEPGADARPDAGLSAAVAAARAAGTAIHCVLAGPAGERDLRRLAETTGGRVLRAPAERQIPAACARIVLGLQSRYEITYRAEEQTHSAITVAVHGEGGMGERTRLVSTPGEPEECDC